MLGFAIVVLCMHAAYGACPHIITRAEWGARAPHGEWYLTNPVQYAFIHHSAGSDCHDRASCQAQVKIFQNYHMDTHGWPDIGYTYVIGGDGSVFEGRGWDKVGAHTLNYNSVGYGFCMIGTFTSHMPTAAAQQAVKDLIDCGVQLGKIKHDYTLRGHRDMPGSTTECPGTMLWNAIKHWPRY